MKIHFTKVVGIITNMLNEQLLHTGRLLCTHVEAHHRVAAGRRDQLTNNGSHSCTHHAPAEAENENGVQNDVQHRTRTRFVLGILRRLHEANFVEDAL